MHIGAGTWIVGDISYRCVGSDAVGDVEDVGSLIVFVGGPLRYSS